MSSEELQPNQRLSLDETPNSSLLTPNCREGGKHVRKGSGCFG